MKRDWMLLSLLVLVCVVLGVGAVGASAALPEFVECQKVKGTGGYKDGACAVADPSHKGDHEITAPSHRCVLAVKGAGGFTGAYGDRHCTELDPKHEGRYELTEGVGKGKPFKSKGAWVRLRLRELGPFDEREISCFKSSASGLVTGPKTIAGLKFLLTDCKGPVFPESEECSSEGQSGGTILIGPFTATLGYINAAAHRVGIPIPPEAGPQTVFCNYDGMKLRLDGALTAELRGDQAEFGKKFELALVPLEGSGGQEPGASTYEFNFPVMAEEFSGPKPLDWNGTFVNSGETLRLDA
jgi:hypothetical protein